MSDQPPIDPTGSPPPAAGPPGGQGPQPGHGQTPPPQTPPAAPPGPYGPPGAPNVQDERLWATLCHIAAFAGFVIPLGNVLGPLTVWLIKKDVYPLVDDQGKEALNFNISVIIYAIVGLILVFALIGFPLLIALGIFWLVVTIMAAMAANRGERYRYPLCIRIVT